MKQLFAAIAKNIILTLVADSDRLRILAYRPMLETWRNDNKGKYPIFNDRKEMYRYINNDIIKNQAIAYLEFGVFKGDSIKYFASINTTAESTFVGFDTFTGLPEDWVEFSRTVETNTFDTGGNFPKIDDNRISFQKGMFQETLPDFLKKYQAGKQLVIHNDSDLFSSTLYVLSYLNEIMVPGTIVIFDEFYSVMHEYRALEDFCSAYMRKYEVLAATTKELQVVIRFL